jgi:hypothetical protein
MTTTFGITFDYLCPFARNANEHVIAGLRGGADWDVTFVPYSLAQGHVEDGGTAVWDREDPNRSSGILALQTGIAVRDRFPDQFLDTHWELFAARHDRGEDLRDRDVIAKALDAAHLDPTEVFALLEDGGFLRQLREEHERAVTDHEVWGVPTFIGRDRAVFVRVLDRHDSDIATSVERIESIMMLVDGFPDLHEFKQTDLPV